MNLYAVMLALEVWIGRPENIFAPGDFVKSDVWVQIMADIFDQEVHVTGKAERTCLGPVE